MTLADLTVRLVTELVSLPDSERIAAINEVRAALHSVSPLKHHPIDLVLWVPADSVEANGYNPNVVSPPELRLLELSIENDHYTQPVVTWLEGERRETVDGFHRGEIGRTSRAVRESTLGHLPVTTVNASRTDLSDRMASTVRHNRARGVHRVDGMSAIVQELTRRNWSDERIAKELGMGPDEVLRLKQITGLAELFADREFSEAWEPET
ncbi:MAG TPA: ParB N-terminal domain-containing protein [Polyangiaceae bacterium]|nr:ParB N-terminal domain-containing protein [Polyangiaceae bacterium]